ncbi:semaphorin-5B-like [Mytilus trossulus]|uniref:semaphorin-5B-like n=1 Tax=Mytilus trossulus TaxID=6551 RepID=UPI0030075D7F
MWLLSTNLIMVFYKIIYSVILAHLIQGQSSGDVRLDNSKRLEIYYNGVWGTVCDDDFDDNDARVVCRQLGFSNGISLGNAVDDGSGTTWLDDMKCTGSESKLKYCSHAGWGVEDCKHEEDVGVLCNDINSPVNGGWSRWAQWTTCSSSCNDGLQTRLRGCNNPSPQYGGTCCPGESSQTKQCNIISCPVDGSWGDWSMWKSCNVTCGGGKQLRLRKCDRPVPAFGGVNCPSTDSEFRQCNTAKCIKVIDGIWSEWTQWTDCTRRCNGGLKERARSCDNPPPINGGSYCNGTSTEADLCNTISCSGIETKMILALLVGGVSVGCILITIALMLLSIRVTGCTRKQKKDVAESRLTDETEELYIYQASEQPAQVKTNFKEDPEELYIYQESDQPIKANTGFKEDTEELYIYQESDNQPTQSFNNSAYRQDFNSKDVAKTGEDVDPCDIYENYEENCYANF